MQQVIETYKKSRDWNYLCRECKHFHYHNATRDKIIECRFVQEGKCDCVEYAPEDNLEYLEWKSYKELHRNDWLNNFVQDKFN